MGYHNISLGRGAGGEAPLGGAKPKEFFMARMTQARKAEVIEAALQAIATGRGLNAFCEESGIAFVTLWRWLDAHEKAHPDAAPWAQAREMAVCYLTEECLAIADDARNDWMAKRGGEDAGYALNGERVQRSKLRIDTRLRLIERWSRPNNNKDVDKAGAALDAAVTIFELPDNARENATDTDHEADPD